MIEKQIPQIKSINETELLSKNTSNGVFYLSAYNERIVNSKS